MATTKNVQRTPSGRLTYRGETFSGYNKPKRSKKGGKKSVVLAKKRHRSKNGSFWGCQYDHKKGTTRTAEKL